MDRREALKAIFEDTMRQISRNPALKEPTEKSKDATVLYEKPTLLPPRSGSSQITVTKSRTFEAAMRLNRPDRKIAVLNFASATNPGGGVKNGSSAQEECLCRSSNLFPILDQQRLWDGYYARNRAAHNPLHTDACIYSPGVTIFKTDEDYPTMMAQKDWVRVDVISCAAPNLRPSPSNQYNVDPGDAANIQSKELHDIHLQRAKGIMSVAVENNVDTLVLGAFGCGAFMNDPSIVAEAYRDALDEMAGYFQVIEFAVYCRPGFSENYEIFRATMRQNS